MGALKVYSGDEVAGSFGPVIMEGKGPDEFCRIESESDSAEDESGVDNEVVVSVIKDGRATVTWTLMQTANANDQLTVVRNLFVSAPGAAGGILPLSVKDFNGRKLYGAANAWILKAPDVGFAKAAGVMAWPIRCAFLKRFDGGN